MLMAASGARDIGRLRDRAGAQFQRVIEAGAYCN